ncbi:Uncharacterised protein [Klebsiella pneumoniae subsp. ozaenae]|uniref:Uncharacterized protein n=1 Tax=Klebsiella pneumoniae subsp. ozaenae TaxID=574 RepID=A0A378B8M9_KLEPO|nr:Uncharacterised protein [Klebsiella pneumoniae subsp. ozaenae]
MIRRRPGKSVRTIRNAKNTAQRNGDNHQAKGQNKT